MTSLDFPRTRDCIVLFKGDAYPVTISEEMAVGGWVGGQGVKWAPSAKDEFLVTYSDGLYAGFMLWGSNESSELFTGMTQNQVTYRFGTCCAGGWQISTIAYERYTWESRQGPGPLVEIEYHASDRLVFSNRGLWTTEDEFTLSHDPRAPNDYYIAFVSQAPSIASSWYLGVQTSI